MKNPRWCSRYNESRNVTTTVTFKYNNKKYTEMIKCNPIPSNIGEKITPKSVNKGSAIDRYNQRFLKKLSEVERMSIFLANKEYSPKENTLQIKKKIIDDNFHLCLDETFTICQTKKRKEKVLRSIKFPPGLEDSEIKRITGFINELHMLSYITVVCNSNFNGIGYLPSLLSWYEEWLLYLEMVWGKSIQRWIDASSYINYQLDSKQLRIIFDRKLE